MIEEKCSHPDDMLCTRPGCPVTRTWAEKIRKQYREILYPDDLADFDDHRS